jgi:hypothetical protein
MIRSTIADDKTAMSVWLLVNMVMVEAPDNVNTGAQIASTANGHDKRCTKMLIAKLTTSVSI